MNTFRVALTSALVLCSSGCCHTVIIRPASAPNCEIPAEFLNACIEKAKPGDALTYGDLPDLVLSTRKDFVECRKTYQEITKSYSTCVAGLSKYNKSLKTLEDQMKGKYKDATIVQQD